MKYETLMETYFKNACCHEHQIKFIWNAALDEALTLPGSEHIRQELLDMKEKIELPNFFVV